MILIYTIDKNSEVSGQSKQPRENLFLNDQEKHHVIGLAIAFPETNETEEERRLHSTDFWALGGVNYEPKTDSGTDQ